jgi:hypothetical protein
VLAQVDTNPLREALTNAATFLPKLLAFLAILIIGYFVAKAIAKVVDKVLERVGFDRAVERGGVKKALAKSQYDASSILSKIVFYALFLFVLQMAFGVFGPNPISQLIFAVIAFLPKIFVAIIILVIASAIAAAVRELIVASLGGLSYGSTLGTAASAAILLVGVFAALNQLEIAPAIVNGLFYAILAVIAGSAIIAIGGGGIVPMRNKWEQAMGTLETESGKIREEAASTSKEDLQAHARNRQQQLEGAGGDPESNAGGCGRWRGPAGVNASRSSRS